MDTYNTFSSRPVATLLVDADNHHKRLDVFLSEQLVDVSRTACKNLIADGAITLAGILVTKASVLVKAGDTIIVTFPDPALIVADPEKTVHLNVRVIFEHEHFLVISKPAGLTVHAPSPQSTEVTLVDWVVTYCAEIKGVGASERPGIVHRLDKNTSGIMLVARTTYGHTTLSALFKDRAIKKVYHALVQGHPPRTGKITYTVTRHPTIPTRMTHAIGYGRDALTEYTTLAYYEHAAGKAALVEARPLTGRTHQIRVHLSALDYPLLGDEVYGSASPYIKRHALHAAEISFTFEGKQYFFKEPAPDDFQHAIKLLEKNT